MTPSPLPFVGRARRRLVEALLGHVEETTAARRPRLVTLEAGTGWGKTRLLQELYGQLAAQQPEPAYWPATILGGDTESLTLEERRKRLFPVSFTPPPAAVPHWFWWGITASAHRSGTAVQALAQDLVQVEAHAPALERRWRELAGSGQKAARLLGGEDAAELGAVLRDEGISRAAEAVLGSAVPGLGFLMWAGGVLWRQRQRWSAAHREPQPIDARGIERTDLVTELAASLASFTGVGIPAIIVVEDLHDADPSLVDLLTQALTAPTGPVMVIATCWPGLLDRPEVTAHRLLEEVPGARVHRMRQPHELPDMEPDALLDLVAHLLPSANAADRELLVSRFTTPLTLEVASSVRSVRDAVDDGDLREADVDDLPRDIEGLYRVVWGQLPPPTRDALMLAALATPRSTGALFRDATWDPDVVAAALTALPWLDDAVCDVLTGDGEDGTAYAWVRRVDEWLRRFHEPVQLDIAVDYSAEELGRRRRAAVHEALAARLDPSAADLSPSRRRWQAQMLLSLAAEGFVTWTPPVWESLDLLVDEARDQPDVESLRTVVALLTTAPRTEDEAGLLRRRHLANALRTLDRSADALAELDELLRLRRAAGDTTSDAHADDLDLTASTLTDLGETDRALELSDTALALASANHPADSPPVWRARNNHAIRLDRAGRTEQSLRHLEDLVADIGGVDDTAGDYRTARANLAYAYLKADDLVHALHVSQTTVHMLHTQGLASAAVGLHARDTLAYAAWRSGAYALARGVAAELVADAETALGAEHPWSARFRTTLEFVTDAVPEQAEIEVPAWSPQDPTVLLLGRDPSGAPQYAYLRVAAAHVDALTSALKSGAEVRAADWGTVLATGVGDPSARVRALTGTPDLLLSFTARDGGTAPA